MVSTPPHPPRPRVRRARRARRARRVRSDPGGEGPMATVREATFDLFRAHGMTTIFGNPGSTELPMLADFPDDFTYVLGLQELVVMGMADGYAQATAARPTSTSTRRPGSATPSAGSSTPRPTSHRWSSRPGSRFAPRSPSRPTSPTAMPPSRPGPIEVRPRAATRPGCSGGIGPGHPPRHAAASRSRLRVDPDG